MNTREKHLMLQSIFAVLLCALLFTPTASAAIGGYRITIREQNKEKISYQIECEASGKSVVAVVSTYFDGQQSEIKLDSFHTEGTAHIESKWLSKPYNSFKLMLLDGETYAPLSDFVGLHTVRFTDYDGSVLASRRVLTGQTVVPPIPPKRDGYLFKRWSADYSEIRGDMTIVAEYVENTASNIFTVSSAAATAGEEVSILVKMNGTVNVCGYDFRLHYNGDILEYVGIDTEQAFDVVANHVESGHYVRMNFAARKNRTVGGDVVRLTFRAKDVTNTATRIFIEPISVICVDSNNENDFLAVEYTLCDGMVIVE